jgi:hypothetical protein
MLNQRKLFGATTAIVYEPIDTNALNIDII